MLETPLEIKGAQGMHDGLVCSMTEAVNNPSF